MNLFVKKLVGVGLLVLSAVFTLSVSAMNVGSLPLFFSAAHDQSGAFVAHGRDSQFTISSTGTDFVLRQSDCKTSAVRMEFLGAQPAIRVSGAEPLAGKINYFTGSDPSAWQTGISTFQQVHLTGIYPGVDATYYGNQQRMEYDLDLAAGVSPSVINIRFAGAQKLSINGQGELVIGLAGGEIIQHQPVAYQNEGAARHDVQAVYRIIGADTVTFSIPAYDHALPLVIDPVLGFSTFFGGNAGDAGFGITLDSSGYIYVVGQTFSTAISNAVTGKFPSPRIPLATTNAYQTNFAGGINTGDAFVAKFYPNGTNFVYYTYLGGGVDDLATGVAADGSGDAYVTGYTDSTNFPVKNAIFTNIAGPTFSGTSYHLLDAFVTELSPDGSQLVYSTYLGGNGEDFGTAITVDSSGYAYVVGCTTSTNFPVRGAAYQSSLKSTNAFFSNGNAFLAMFAPNGTSLDYSSFFGGTNYDEANAVTLDTAGNIYIAGFTRSTNFPALHNLPANQLLNGRTNQVQASDAFVSMFTPHFSSLVYSTLLGGTNSDVANGIAVDSAGDAYVCGWTTSTNFPNTTNGVQLSSYVRTNTDPFIIATNAFLSKLVWDGTTLSNAYSQVFGGIGLDLVNGVALDPAGNVYLVGTATSTNYPVTTANIFGGLRATNSSIDNFGFYPDVVVTEFKSDLSQLVYSAYVGGASSDYGNGIAVDSAGDAFITGQTLSTNFPTTFQAGWPIRDGTNDAFLAEIVASSPDMLTVLTSGVGNIIPNLNGAILQPGSTNSILASASAGFVFTNWTSGIGGGPLTLLTNGPVAVFVMVPNLVLQANFFETNRPTIDITNVASGQQVSNVNFTVMGNTADKGSVSNVFYNFNNSGWASATSTSGNTFSNWSASVTLVPGSNTLSVYALNTGGTGGVGILSTTDTVNFKYVVSAQLTVLTNGFGFGTLSPNLSGGFLQISNTYSIKATAKTGFVFTNWTGGTGGPLTFLTNGATVIFQMQPDLVLQANFIDVTRPTLSITNLTTGHSVSNAAFTVLGKAQDNVGVANVFYNLNNTGWNSATSGNGFTNWSAAVMLTLGTNTISAYAMDAAGNLSTTDTVSFKNLATPPVPAIVMLSAHVSGDSLIVTLPPPAGVPPGDITLLNSTNFHGPTWATVPVTCVMTNGVYTFCLPFNKTNPAAFYRVGQ